LRHSELGVSSFPYQLHSRISHLQKVNGRFQRLRVGVNEYYLWSALLLRVRRSMYEAAFRLLSCQDIRKL
jgi:hypothetical protein